MCRQGSRSHRSDTYKVEFLSGAVEGYEWAIGPLSRVKNAPKFDLNFQQLYGELESQLQLAKGAEVARLKDAIFAQNSDRKLGYNVDVTGILYNGQARYGQRPSSVQHRGDQRRVSFASPNQQVKRLDQLSISGCFNCDDPSHMVKNCTKR